MKTPIEEANQLIQEIVSNFPQEWLGGRQRSLLEKRIVDILTARNEEITKLKDALRTYEEADGYHGGYGPNHLSKVIVQLKAEVENWREASKNITEVAHDLLAQLAEAQKEQTCDECWQRFHPGIYNGEYDECPIAGGHCPHSAAKVAYKCLQGSLDQLRAQLAESERLQDYWIRMYNTCWDSREEWKRERERLQAEIDELSRSNQMWFNESKKAYAEKQELLKEKDKNEN